jgi:tetratricopeptide (TPR) repeat protein
MTHYFWILGDQDRAIEFGQRALALATALSDFALQVTTHFRLGQVYHALGDYRGAVEFLGRNIASLEGERLRERFGLTAPASVHSRTWFVWCLAELGAFAEGIARGEEGVRIAEEVGNQFALVDALFGVGGLYLCKGDLPQAIPVLERGLERCQVANIPLLFPRVASLLGYAYVLSGRVGEAVSLLERAVEQTASRRLMFSLSLWVSWLSEAYLRACRIEEASARARRALQLARDHKERGNQAYALRLLGEIAARREPLEYKPAEAHYRQALTLAEELGMRPLQAHCHRGLGTLYAATGQREQARTALSTAIAMYRDMEMTFWLPQTEAALAQVEGAGAPGKGEA